MSVKPKDGDFVVAQSRWNTEVRQVIKVSASVYYYKSDWRNKEMRARLDEVLFAGSEAAAKRLREQLVSSEAQYSNDCKNAALRRQGRDADFIAKASAVTSTNVCAGDK
jgi:hypothetical protein